MLKTIKAALIALLLPALAYAQSYPSPTFNNLTVQGTFTLTGGLPAASLAAQAANTVLANVTAASASPTAVTLPSCSTSASALTYTSATGFSCGTVATSGANSNITSLSGLTTPLSVAQGGTGASSITQYDVVVGGSSAFAFVGPSTSGYVLMSNGATSYPSFQAIPWASPGSIGSTTPAAGAFTTLSATGLITPSTTNGIKGTTGGDNANAGSVGEYISSSVPSGSAVGLTAGSAANVTSISLTAGDWDVRSSVCFTLGSGNTTYAVLGGINTTSATLTWPNGFYVPGVPTGTTIECAAPPTLRENVTSTTTVYLVAQASWASGSASAYGFIAARRVR